MSCLVLTQVLSCYLVLSARIIKQTGTKMSCLVPTNIMAYHILFTLQLSYLVITNAEYINVLLSLNSSIILLLSIERT